MMLAKKTNFARHISPSLAGQTMMYQTGSSSDLASLLFSPSQFPSGIRKQLFITAAGPRRNYTDFSIKRTRTCSSILSWCRYRKGSGIEVSLMHFRLSLKEPLRMANKKASLSGEERRLTDNRVVQTRLSPPCRSQETNGFVSRT